MVLMLDGNSEIGAHDQSKLFDLLKAFDEVKKSHKPQTWFPLSVRNMFLGTLLYCYHGFELAFSFARSLLPVIESSS